MINFKSSKHWCCVIRLNYLVLSAVYCVWFVNHNLSLLYQFLFLLFSPFYSGFCKYFIVVSVSVQWFTQLRQLQIPLKSVLLLNVSLEGVSADFLKF